LGNIWEGGAPPWGRKVQKKVEGKRRQRIEGHRGDLLKTRKERHGRLTTSSKGTKTHKLREFPRKSPAGEARKNKKKNCV